MNENQDRAIRLLELGLLECRRAGLSIYGRGENLLAADNGTIKGRLATSSVSLNDALATSPYRVVQDCDAYVDSGDWS